MRYLKASKSRRGEKDVRHNGSCYFSSKAEDAAHDEVAERVLMKQKMLAKGKVSRLKMIKKIAENDF